ncbi:MAG: phosphoserine phosphatase SerB [Burkholderiales bacterium]|nr:phosphoserine phosphatase SerB [Burkholderiales bacterium]
MRIDLVIQGEDVASADLRALHTICSANGIERIEHVAHQAFRLAGADASDDSREAVRKHCDAVQIDFAFVPTGRGLGDIGLLAMDMDSTLITIECIDEIADFIGKKAQVSAVTAAAMRGEIDWPESLRRRVALLAGLEESALQTVYDERLKLSPGTTALIATAKKHGIKTLLVSGGFTFFTDRLKSRLDIDYAFSNLLEIANGKLTGNVTGPLCDADSKARHLRETAVALSLRREQCVAIGDGANDLKMMREAGLSVAYRAKPIVQAQASVAINHVGLDGVLAFFA